MEEHDKITKEPEMKVSTMWVTLFLPWKSIIICVYIELYIYFIIDLLWMYVFRILMLIQRLEEKCLHREMVLLRTSRTGVCKSNSWRMYWPSRTCWELARLTTLLRWQSLKSWREEEVGAEGDRTHYKFDSTWVSANVSMITVFQISQYLWIPWQVQYLRLLRTW